MYSYVCEGKVVYILNSPNPVHAGPTLGVVLLLLLTKISLDDSINNFLLSHTHTKTAPPLKKNHHVTSLTQVPWVILFVYFQLWFELVYWKPNVSLHSPLLLADSQCISILYSLQFKFKVAYDQNHLTFGGTLGIGLARFINTLASIDTLNSTKHANTSTDHQGHFMLAVSYTVLLKSGYSPHL